MLKVEIGTYNHLKELFRLLNFTLATTQFVIFSRTFFLLALVVL